MASNFPKDDDTAINIPQHVVREADDPLSDIEQEQIDQNEEVDLLHPH